MTTEFEIDFDALDLDAAATLADMVFDFSLESVEELDI